MTTKYATALLIVLSSIMMAHNASAHVPGINDCNPGYQPVLHYNTVDVPHYMSNAQRGDILLSAGGNGVPRDIFMALGQTYNHIMMISQGLDNAGNTRLTHDTAISPGEKLIDAGGVAPFIPHKVRRLIPGNVIGDTASDLVRGKDEHCLNTKDFADCGHARPKNIWMGANILLRPSSQYFGQNDVVNAAESHPEGSLLYAFGAYSNHSASYHGTGHEAPYGRGTMCSGFVAEAVNTALVNNGHAGLTIQPVFYNNAQREAAAVALHRRIYNDALPVLQAHWSNYVTLGISAPVIAMDMARQLVNCFAHGGACDNDGAWTNVNVMNHNFGASPTSSSTNLNSTSPVNLLATGNSLSPDNVMDDALANGWATQVNTSIMGGYSIQRFSHIMCCPPNTTSGGGCYRPMPTAVEAEETRGEYTVFDGGDGIDDGRELPLKEAISSSEGEFVETETNICYVSKVGSVCTALPEEDTPTETETAVEAQEAEQRTFSE